MGGDGGGCSSGVKCGLDNGVEELRCSSICGGAMQGTNRYFNPFICLPERIQPDTRHPPCRGPFSQPSPPNPQTPATSSHPSSRVALQEPHHSHQILIFLLMTRRFGNRVLTASLLRDEVRPHRVHGFLLLKPNVSFLFFQSIQIGETRRRLKPLAFPNHWLTGRCRVTPQLFVSPHYNNCICVCVGALVRYLSNKSMEQEEQLFHAAADYVAQVSVETLWRDL